MQLSISTDKLQNDHVSTSFPAIPFPFEVLPNNFRLLNERYSKALQCSPEFMAMNFMTVISGTVGNSVTLEIKRSWQAAPFLWFGIIDKSGGGKTHPQDAAMKPLIKLQSMEVVKYDKIQSDYKTEKAAYDKSKKEISLPPEPAPMRHYFSQNFTIEGLIPMYQQSARGIVLHVDELAGLLKSLNQYKGGKGSDDEQFLSLFNCGTLKSDRATKNGFCRESGAAVMGGIQPEIFSCVFGEKQRANGMLYRFLPMLLESIPPMFTEDDLSQTDEDQWSDIVDWMYGIPAITDSETGCIQKNRLVVNTDGKAIWKQFHDELSTIQPFMPANYRGYLPKLKTYCLKFMAVLHLLKCYENSSLVLIVTSATVEVAIKLTRYFAGQAFLIVSGAAEEANPYHATLRKAIQSLLEEVDGGQLLLSRIRERMNEGLPANCQIDASQNKRVGTWVKEIGMVVTKRADNKSVVFIP